MARLIIFVQLSLVFLLSFFLFSQVAISNDAFGMTEEQIGDAALLDVLEEDDHYVIKAIRGSYEFWQIKVDKQSGGIFSFLELDSENEQDYLGTEGYGRKVTLLHFKGRGGSVFARRYQITDHPIRFEIAPDGSSFEIIYEELSSQAANFFHHSYAAGDKTLSPGDMLCSISLKITPPTEQGTKWDWKKTYTNVSDHQLSSKIWAKDEVFTALSGSFEAQASSENSGDEGEWDEANPLSYMRWTIDSYSDQVFTTPSTLTVDLESGIFQNPVAGRNVVQTSWAGFDFLEWNAGFDYSTHLDVGATKTVEGSVLINIKDERAKLEVTENQVEAYYEVVAKRGENIFWKAKVDSVSGGIFYFEDVENAISYMGNEGYFRNVSLISFTGRGGSVFRRRYQIEDREVQFNIAPDGSYFELVYDEGSTQSSDFFQNVYGHSSAPLNPGDLMTKISLKLLPPTSSGTAWTWTKTYENVSDHAITNKVWAKDYISLSLHSDSEVQSIEETSLHNGGWDFIDPKSFMGYSVSSYSGFPLESNKNFSVDILDGMNSNWSVGQGVRSVPWAGFHNLQWNTYFAYSGVLESGESRSYEGAFYFDIDDVRAASDEESDSGTSPHYTEDTVAFENQMQSLNPQSPLVWGETQVRKILHTFALGSQVSDNVIQSWANMTPEESVREMLSLNVFNPSYTSDLLSGNAYDYGELLNLSEMWAEEPDALGNPQTSKYGRDGYRAPSHAWHRAIVDPYVNPVRQRIGFFETSDHMSISFNSDANARQVFRYYDDIMNALAQGSDYQEVLAIGAKSAAIATQYNHRQNIYEQGVFYGNEDFAREFHQLFFGILGVADPAHHEQITIRNTAKALTDMVVEIEYMTSTIHLEDEVVFGSQQHHQGDLDILGEQISGSNASEKISHLAEVAINHPESLSNLPIKIVESLGDPGLSEDDKEVLRQAWNANAEKNLLAYLRKYASSDLFHSEDRFRFWTTMEKQIIIHQRMQTDADESKLPSLASFDSLLTYNNAAFHPFHDVFGPMTGQESVSNSDHFIMAWDNSTKYNYRFIKIINDDQERDWRRVLSPDQNGAYPVEYVAEWLWQRFIADGLKNFGVFERAQVYALLAEGSDYQVSFDENEAYASYDSSTLENDPLHQDHFENLKNSMVALESTDDYARGIANQRIGLAISFITMTPYMFAQEGL